MFFFSRKFLRFFPENLKNVDIFDFSKLEMFKLFIEFFFLD